MTSRGPTQPRIIIKCWQTYENAVANTHTCTNIYVYVQMFVYLLDFATHVRMFSSPIRCPLNRVVINRSSLLTFCWSGQMLQIYRCQAVYRPRTSHQQIQQPNLLFSLSLLHLVDYKVSNPSEIQIPSHRKTLTASPSLQAQKVDEVTSSFRMSSFRVAPTFERRISES